MKDSICRTCAFWRAGASPNALIPVPDDSDADTGVCEVMSPDVQIGRDGAVISVQPPTHATRSCAMWEPGDGNDGGGRRDGRDHTPSHRENIRNLFPVQPAPVAA